MNTLYHSNKWLQMVPIFLQNQPALSGNWQLPAFAALCLSPCPVPAATVPVVVSCVARWSQWGSAIPVIRLMFSELSTWAAARAPRTRKPSDEAVLQESARADSLWKSNKTDVLWGVAARLIWAGWHSGYVVPLPHLDSDSFVCLGISKFDEWLRNKTKAKPTQEVLLLKKIYWRELQGFLSQVVLPVAGWQMNHAD